MIIGIPLMVLMVIVDMFIMIANLFKCL